MPLSLKTFIVRYFLTSFLTTARLCSQLRELVPNGHLSIILFCLIIYTIPEKSRIYFTLTQGAHMSRHDVYVLPGDVDFLL